MVRRAIPVLVAARTAGLALAPRAAALPGLQRVARAAPDALRAARRVLPVTLKRQLAAVERQVAQARARAAPALAVQAAPAVRAPRHQPRT